MATSFGAMSSVAGVNFWDGLTPRDSTFVIMCGAAIARHHPEPHVPISHELRYFFCSGVSLSILMPIELSFRAAISESIFSGTM